MRFRQEALRERQRGNPALRSRSDSVEGLQELQGLQVLAPAVTNQEESRSRLGVCLGLPSEWPQRASLGDQAPLQLRLAEREAGKLRNRPPIFRLLPRDQAEMDRRVVREGCHLLQARRIQEEQEVREDGHPQLQG